MTAFAPSLSPARTHAHARAPRVGLVIGGFAAAVLVLLATHQGAALRMGVPLAGTAVAFWVYRNAGFPAYAAFVWWFWFLAPGLRRVVDYQSGGWNPANPISLAPLFVTSIALLPVLRRLAELRRPSYAPFVIAIGCILYGYFSGILNNGFLAATHSFVSWIIPLLFGLALATEWRRYPESSARLTRAFIWGGTLLAAYALYQFLAPPIWDQLWVESTGMTSVGYALPYQLRVFSLMNGPLLFALALFTTIFVAAAARDKWRIVPIVLSLAALLLTLVRSVWLMVVLAVAVYLYAMPLRLVRRAALGVAVVIGLLGVVIAALPSDVSEPVVTTIQQRVLTLGSLNQDLSYSQRSGFLDQIGGVVLEQPLGHGLGSTGVSSSLGEQTSAIRDFDNGIFAVLYSLGWFAGAAFLGAVLFLIVRSLPRREARDDLLAKAARAIVVALLALSLGGNVFEGFAAMLFWGFVGLLIASHRWESARLRAPKELMV